MQSAQKERDKLGGARLGLNKRGKDCSVIDSGWLIIFTFLSLNVKIK